MMVAGWMRGDAAAQRQIDDLIANAHWPLERRPDDHPSLSELGF
jgi:nuclear transport factor 2 (NTF2) superfamily protein